MAITGAQVLIDIQATQKVDVGLASVSYSPAITIGRRYIDGTDADTKADLVGSYDAPMTTGVPLEVDLRGGQIVDGTGAAIDPAEVVAIALEAPEENTATITVTTSGVNGWQAAIDGVITLPPGGFCVLGAPVGYAVASGTADLLSCDGTTGDSLRIFLLGRSA
jgi:hypothetical protein